MAENSDIAKQLGKRGGQKTMAKYGKDHYRAAGRKSALKRWGTKKEPLVNTEAKKNPLDMPYTTE